MHESAKKNDPTGDVAKILWILKDGATPMKRIYSTAKHLGSKKGVDDLANLVEKLVKDGILTTQPHPFTHNQFFYSINPEGIGDVWPRPES